MALKANVRGNPILTCVTTPARPKRIASGRRMSPLQVRDGILPLTPGLKPVITFKRPRHLGSYGRAHVFTYPSWPSRPAISTPVTSDCVHSYPIFDSTEVGIGGHRWLQDGDGKGIRYRVFDGCHYMDSSALTTAFFLVAVGVHVRNPMMTTVKTLDTWGSTYFLSYSPPTSSHTTKRNRVVCSWRMCRGGSVRV